MRVVNSKRIAELSMDLSQLLRSHPGGLSRNQALVGLIDSAGVASQEMATHPYRPFVPLFEEMIRVGNVALVRAGWLAEGHAHWALTRRGLDALEHISEPDRFLKAAANHSIRARLAITFPALYIALRRLKYQLSVDYSLVKRVGIRRIVARSSEPTPAWHDVLPMQTACADPGGEPEVTGFLDSYTRNRPGRAHYISGQDSAGTPLNAIARTYPVDASFVIVRSVRRGPNNQASKSFPILAANLLFNKGLGPRLYDVIQAGEGELCFRIFVIGGRELKPAVAGERAEAYRRLSLLAHDGLIGFRASGDESPTTQPPDDAIVLVNPEGRLNYVCFEDIVLKDYETYLKKEAADAVDSSHFGDRSLLRGGHYLYQSIPGVRLPARRNTKARMATICRLMELTGVRFKGNLVLDVGCNIGMMMAEYLRLGVRWCHGWDRVDVAPHAERLLSALGCTRFSMTGGDIAQSARLEDDIPEFVRPALAGCIVSYLAVRKNLGFLDCLGRIPWSLLIYEGHEEETREDFERYLLDLRRMVDVEIKAIGAYRDGDCGDRIVAMITRA